MDEGGEGIGQASRQFVEQLKTRRDWCIKEAGKITRILDYLDGHPDAKEFVMLFEEIQEQEQQRFGGLGLPG